MIVVGGGGLALQLLDDLKASFSNGLQFYADHNNYRPLIKANFVTLENLPKPDSSKQGGGKDLIIAVGGPEARQKLFYNFKDIGFNPVTFISPRAQVSEWAKVATGTVILSGAILEAGVQVGTGCLINVKATITHECSLGSFVEVGPSVTIVGQVTVGDNTFIGTGTTIIPGVRIGKNVLIAAGSVVTQDIPDYSMVAGVPAMVKKKLDPK